MTLREKSEAMYPVTPVRLHDIPATERPREVFERVGAENVEREVLLALILRSGVKGMNVVQLARKLLEEYGSLTQLAQASVEDIARRVKGMGKVKAQVLKAALELGQRLSQESAPARPAIRTPAEAAQLLQHQALTLEQEKFWVLLLDAKNRLKRSPVEVTSGLSDASLVHSREVFKEAIRHSCNAVVILHNHPSGDPTPSAEDIQITRQLVQAGRVVDIKVLDHIILGHDAKEHGREYLSLRESGLVEFPS